MQSFFEPEYFLAHLHIIKRRIQIEKRKGRNLLKIYRFSMFLRTKGYVGMEILIVAGMMIAVGLLLFLSLRDGSFADVIDTAKPALDSVVVKN